jgi:hypothetical protein
MLDRVGVVWTSLLEELLEVVRGRPHLALAIAYGSHDTHHAEAACLLVVATIVVGRGYGLLKALLAHLLAALGNLHGVLESDIG